MGRYRSPTPKASPYITPEGFESMQVESKQLWVRRAQVTKALSAAAAEGDRSENAEYIYRKKELREIDRRIRYLQKRMPELKVVSEQPTNLDIIYFGAIVTLEDDNGAEVTYRIVGSDEFDPKKGWISMDAPLAKALLGKNLDDEISVKTPKGITNYLVIEISYNNHP